MDPPLKQYYTSKPAGPSPHLSSEDARPHHSSTSHPLALSVSEGSRVTSHFFSGVAPTLEAASFSSPIDKPLHVFSVFPGKVEKLASVQVGCFLPKKRLKHVLRHGRFAQPSLFRH
jgi:hypothetical protein